MTEETTSADAGNVAATTITEAATTTTSTATATQSWRDSLPDDIKSVPTLSKFETIEGLAKSYVNLEKTLGSERVAIPKDGDTEGWERFYKAAGAPDAPGAYGFKAPEKVPDGMVYNPELDTQIAGIFHGAKLNPQQAAKVREGLLEIVGKGATESLDASKANEAARQAAIQQGEQALKAEWGTAYEQRGKVAGAAINKFLSPETIAAVEAAGLASNPAIVKDMYTLGVKLAGEKELIGASENSLSPADLDSTIASHREKYGAALFDRSHPDHALRTKELTALFERRFPEQAA